MSCRSKISTRLAALDDDLRARAVALLRDVASGRNTHLFVADEVNPWPRIPSSPEGTDLMRRAENIVELAQRAGEDPSPLAATKLLRAFRKANDLDDAHRPGPIRLAASLLEELCGSR